MLLFYVYVFSPIPEDAEAEFIDSIFYVGHPDYTCIYIYLYIYIYIYIYIHIHMNVSRFLEPLVSMICALNQGEGRGHDEEIHQSDQSSDHSSEYTSSHLSQIERIQHLSVG